MITFTHEISSKCMMIQRNFYCVLWYIKKTEKLLSSTSQSFFYHNLIMKTKYTTKRNIQITEMIFQTRSRKHSFWRFLFPLSPKLLLRLHHPVPTQEYPQLHILYNHKFSPMSINPPGQSYSYSNYSTAFSVFYTHNITVFC